MRLRLCRIRLPDDVRMPDLGWRVYSLWQLNAIKEEVETVNKKLQELTEEELAQVTGGIQVQPPVIIDTSRGRQIE